VPDSNDTAIFDGNSGNKDCTLTANTTVGALDMQSAYAGDVDTTTSNYDFTVKGTFTVNGGDFFANDSTITVEGNMDLTGGNFSGTGSSLVVFDGTTSLTSAGTTFDSVQVGTATGGGSLTLLDQADIDGTLSILNGGATTLDLTNQTLNYAGSTLDLTNLDTFTETGSTVAFDGTTSLTSASNSFNNVQVGTAASGGSLTLSDQADIDGTLSVLNGGATTLDLNSQTLLAGGNVDLTNLDTFTVTGSKVVFDGTTSLTSASHSFNNVDIGTATGGGSLTLSDQADIDGTLSVLNGGATTLNLTSQTLQYAGSTLDLTNLDTFTVTGSTVAFDGTTSLTSAGEAFNNVQVGTATSGGSLTLSDQADIDGTLSVQNGGATTLDLNSQTLLAGGNVNLTNLDTFTVTGSTVAFDGTTSLTSASKAFNNVQVGTATSGGSLTLSDLAEIDGTLSVLDGGATTLDITSRTLVLGGNVDLTNLDTFTVTGSSVSFDGTTSLTSAGYSFNNVLLGSGVSGGSLTLSDQADFDGFLSVLNNGATTLDLTSQTLLAGGDVNLTNLDTFTVTGSTVAFDGTTSLTSVGNTFNNVQVGTATSGGSLTLSDQGDINGTLSFLEGGATTLDLTSQTLLYEGTTLDLTNLDTFTVTGSTVTFDNGSTDQTVTSSGKAFNNFTVNNSGAVGSDDIILTDVLDVNGTLRITNGDLQSDGFTINLAGVWVMEGGGSFSPGTTTVNLDGTNQTISGSTTFYNLTKSVSSAASLAFEFNQETTITNRLTLTGESGQLLSLTCPGCGAAQQSKITLDSAGGREQALTYLNVSKSDASGGDLLVAGDSTDGGVTDNWDFGSSSVALVSFDAIGMNGEVLLKWKTASEIDNAGFNLYRSTSRNGRYEKINTSLIPGLGSSSIGRSYSYADSSVTNGIVYYYKLEDIDFKGKGTLHGPVVARPGLDSDGDGMTDDWELYYGLNPYDPSDAALDPDGDGKTNLEEFLAGTDPVQEEEVGKEGESLRIVESTDSHIVMELITTSFEIEEKTGDGELYQLITIPDYIHGYTTEVGSPQLPAKGVLVGVPQGKAIELNILDYEVQEVDGYYAIYPVPGIKEGGESDKKALPSNSNSHSRGKVSVEEEFIKDEEVYGTDALYPDILAEVSSAGSLRDQKTALVTFYPFQHNPVQGRLAFYKRIRVEILFKGTVTEEIAPEKESLPTNGNPAVRISLKEAGMYKLTWDDLNNAGLSGLASADARTIKMYNSGQEIPIQVRGEEDGWFNQSDEILFYAEALSTKYSSENVYWLTYGGEQGLRMQENPGSIEEPVNVPYEFPTYSHFEKDEFYWTELEGAEEIDRWFYSTLIWGGTQKDFTVNLTGVSTAPDLNARFRISMRGFFDIPPYPNHHAVIYLNGNVIGESLWSSNEEHRIETEFPQAYLVEGANTITVQSLIDNGADYDLILADWFEVDYWKELAAEDESLKFGYQGDGTYLFEIPGFSSSALSVFDITNSKDVKYITNFQINSGALSFKDDISGWKEYIATAEEVMKTPEKIELDEPSDLRAPENQADYLIITAEDFYNEVVPLANFRESRGLSAHVVKIQDIYDEFNNGIQSPHAIKDFLKYTYTNWQIPAPTYVLLVGDASYDYKDNFGIGRSNYVPTYMLWTPIMGETGSDNWFVLLDGAEDRLADMFIGRIPARTAQEVITVVDKTIVYELTSETETSSWAQRIILASDDDESVFQESSEELADLLPLKSEKVKLYISSYDNPQAMTQDLINEVNQGALILNYVGHGAIELWASEEVLNTQDIGLFSNGDRLPVVVSMTCLDGYYLHPFTYDSMAETFLMKVNGGAVASLSPTGMGLPTGHAVLNKGLFSAVFQDNNRVLGSAVNQAKLSLYLQKGDRYRDLLQTYTLFGDPALQLKAMVKGKGRREKVQAGTVFEPLFQGAITNYESSKKWRNKDKRSTSNY
jgi:hypothetical protein